MNRAPFLIALASVVSSLWAGAPVPGADVVREGTGDRRAALDAMELTPFDHSLWAGLTDWSNGPAVTPEAAAGKVVVIYTWASYLPTAVRPMSIVSRLVDRYSARGLLVVGVHDQEGFEDGKALAERQKATFAIAKDTGHAMRSALKVDQDPDFYVIDRSGRLRFADIDTGSLERAVSMLVEETTDDATSLLTRMAQAEEAEAEEARRSARLRAQVDLSDLPWVEFPPPSAEAYSAAAWPEPKEEENQSRRRRDAPTGPATIELEGVSQWSPAAPEHTAGRATLIYLITPQIITQASRGGYSAVELFQAMDRVQAAHARDLQVIGVMVRNEEDTRRRRGRNEEGPTEEQAKSDADAFAAITRDLPVNHIRAFDPAGSLVTSRLTPNNGIDGNRGRNAGFLLPYHVLVSSDGQVRWHGAVWTSLERRAEWEAALETVLRVDPGIQARREAEQAYIKSVTD